MRSIVRAALLIGGASLLLGGDCMFGRPIVDDRGRYYPTDGVISCTGTRCDELPAYDLELPPPLEDSPCAQELPVAALDAIIGDASARIGMRYELASEQERELHLGMVQLEDVCLSIEGPVRVNVGAGSKLTNVTILLGPARSTDPSVEPLQGARATPNVHVANAELDRVMLRAAAPDGPSGSAQVEYSTCTQCEAQIDSLTLTESQLQNARIRAGALTVAGGVFDSVELGFEYGLMAGVLANNVRTEACNTLSLVGATIAGRASRIGPCACPQPPTEEDAGEDGDAGDAEIDATTIDADVEPGEPDASVADAGAPDAVEAGAAEPDADVVTDGGPADADTAEAGDAGAHDVEAGALDSGDGGTLAECNGATISQTTFLGGMVDGKVHAENSTFRSVLFARHTDTSLDLWNTTIELSVMCTHPIGVRLDQSSGIGCSSCDTSEQVTLCSLDQAPELTVNPCRVLRDGPPMCEPPLPVRRRPDVPMPPRLGAGGGSKRRNP